MIKGMGWFSFNWKDFSMWKNVENVVQCRWLQNDVQYEKSD